MNLLNKIELSIIGTLIFSPFEIELSKLKVSTQNSAIFFLEIIRAWFNYSFFLRFG